ncbi:MAG: methionyl-tRNA formyltransferase, partial [Thermodesulfobacteriota bacterium]
GDRIEAVVTQPDRPKGRGRVPSPSPVKSAALALDLPIHQPRSVKTPEEIAWTRGLGPDLLVVVAFGQILTPDLLYAPRVGPLNLHPSLLPAYRGPAPINWAILNGETETGVTTMFMDEGVDTGPVLLSRRLVIGEEETAGHLHDRLAEAGAALLLETITALKVGTVIPGPQPPESPFVGRRLDKSDGRIDWTRPAEQLARLVRGLDPWPGAHTTFKGRSVKLFGARPGPGRGEPGRVLALDQGRLHVAAGEGSLGLAELQVEGHRRQSAGQFWNGQRLSRSDYFV